MDHLSLFDNLIKRLYLLVPLKLKKALLFVFLTGEEYDEDLNDEISVQQILRDMLDKKVVEKDVLNDLGFDGSKKKKDPRPKMELRHKQVSYNLFSYFSKKMVKIFIFS